MKSKMRIILTVFFLTAIGVNLLNAQENCALNLKKAQDLFNSGQIEGIPELIESCLQSGFTKEEKVLAYKVLINAYVFDDYREKAEETMFDFLKKYPEYEVISTDPSEFVNLMREFDNRPRFSIGIIAGGTYSIIRPIESVTTSPISGNYGDFTTSGVSYHAGISLIKSLNEKIDLCVEADYKNTVFNQSFDPNSFTSNATFEAQQLINMPISATYTFGNGKYTPFARLGFNTGLLISSGVDLTSTPGDKSSRISNLDSREKLNFYGVIGGGVKMKVSKAYIFLDVRYNLGLKNQVLDIGRNNTQSDALWKYQSRDDSFYHDDLNFSVGFVKTVYKPRKK